MKKKILSCLLCTTMMLGSTSMVLADSVTSSGDYEITVGGEIISTFEVLLPSSITLQAGQPSYDMDVVVTSNTCIGDDEVLSVIPDEVIYLSRNDGEEYVEVPIKQDKTTFLGVEVGEEDVSTVCSLKTGKLNSGSYEGVLKFDIFIEHEDFIYVEGIKRSWDWVTYHNYFKISEDGVLSKGTADLSKLTGTVHISHKVKTIDTKAFEGSNIDTIVLSNTVEAINDAAFMSADKLTKIEVEEGNPNFKSEDGVLLSADGTKLVAYPSGNPAKSYLIPASVTEVGNYAFAYCTNITLLVIPNTITKTGQGAFTDMNVVSPRYTVTKDYDDVTADETKLAEDTGSILMAKKVNNYVTQYYRFLNSIDKVCYYCGFNSNRTCGVCYYSKISAHHKVLSLNSTKPKLFLVVDTTSFIASLNGTTCDIYAYGAPSCEADNQSYKYYIYNIYDHKYNPPSIISSSNPLFKINGYKTTDTKPTFNEEYVLDCNTIFYSEVDVYDARTNELIYKADITK